MTVPGSICGCTTNQCAQDWLDDNVGCDLCITVICEDGSQTGGCSFCDDGTMAYAPNPQASERAE